MLPTVATPESGGSGSGNRGRGGRGSQDNKRGRGGRGKTVHRAIGSVLSKRVLGPPFFFVPFHRTLCL